ncbi:guanine deaminase-like protein [Hapsidospora chrysogenum ATCC 11550]|uniref:Probable guanine deaminase n=1 Tax=Hapsidospora chrysogenum (strain ATCC 11550 / CBS 779.69 / DSM 880 / IAM 14645 / JCM 23072 / IMI 49137) TaxID=857340 RepID=A0A086T7Q7_HAPC1|nr:guanine deaminase-like protein [Hapsidospora chrysogenum ATCC 11550]
MSTQTQIHVFHGTIIHSTSPSDLHIHTDTLLAYSTTTGRIVALVPSTPPSAVPSTLSSLDIVPTEPPEGTTTITYLAPTQFLIPGLIDTHNHAPQWSMRGLGQGMHILDWLSSITFPAEARFSDARHARRTYTSLIRGMLRQGVTTASYYSSLHGPATRILADLCLEHGQRALVGKCNMDRGSPEYYIDDSAPESIAVTKECISHIRSIDPSGSLIRPILTPRFAISCTPELLTSLGALAQADPSLPIQTHFNEAEQEKSATLSLFPEFTDEVSLYRSFNLLTPRTILAHCTIMTDDETARLRELDCGVAHCPTANMTVGGGFMAAPVRDFLERGMKVGLGTDSGGGYSSSMLDAMRHALVASFAREALYGDRAKGLTLDEVFWMATLGGAKVVGLGEEVGNFEVGKQFDAVVVDMSDERGGVNTPLEDADLVRVRLEKFIMTGDDRNIAEVFVKGRSVHRL